MIGFSLIIAIVIWGGISFKIGDLFSKWVLKLVKAQQKDELSVQRMLLHIASTLIFFVLPITDEIISYPKYQSLCEGAGEFHFSAEMNENNVRGREVYMVRTEERIMLFPNSRTLTKAEIQKRVDEKIMSGVVVIKTIDNYVDAKTSISILAVKTIKPISSLFAFTSASGDRSPWLLKECGVFGHIKGRSNPEFYKSLQLKQAEPPINNYIQKE